MDQRSDSLLESHRVLLQLRPVDSWWRLFALAESGELDRHEADRALGEQLALDLSWGDRPSADTHGFFRDVLLLSLDLGVEAAQQRLSAEALQHMPVEIRPELQKIDRAILGYVLTGNRESLQSANAGWIDIASSVAIDDLALPLRSSLLCDAAMLHLEAFNTGANPASLDHAIGVLELAMSAFRKYERHPPYCRICLDPRLQTLTARLASALRTRFARNSNRADLDKARGLGEALLHTTHPRSPEYPLALAGLAVTLGYFGPAEIKLASAALQTAIDIEPRGSRDRVRFMKMRARGLLSEYRSENDAQVLDEALDCLTTAVDEAGIEDAAPSKELAEALFLRSARCCSVADARSALEMMQRAFPDAENGDMTDRSIAKTILQAITPILPNVAAAEMVDAALDALLKLSDDNAIEAAATANHLAAQLSQRFEEGQDQRSLDLAIRLFDYSVHADTTRKLRSRRLNSLAIAHLTRFGHGGDTRDMSAAITAADSAVAELDEADEEYADRRQTVGNLRYQRFEIAGVLTDLHEAIAIFESAVPGTNEQRHALSAERQMSYLGNLAGALRARGERYRRSDDLDSASTLYKEVLQVAERTGSDAAVSQALGNLSAAYHDRFRFHRNRPDLDSAIDGWERAVGISESTQARAANRHNLAAALIDRYRCDTDVSDLGTAIELLSTAIGEQGVATPDRALAENLLAEAYSLRGGANRDSRDKELSAHWSRTAVDHAAHSSAESLFRVSWDWGSRSAKQASWKEAAEAYSTTLRAMRRLFEINLTRMDKESWLELAFGVPTRAAYALALSGEAQQAVIALEWGRALSISELVGVTRVPPSSDADPQHAEHVDRYRAARASWRNLARRVSIDGDGRAPVTMQEADDARREILESISNLRAVGVDVYAPPAYDEICQAITEPVVYLVPGFEAGLAILVEPGTDQPVVIELDALGEKSVGRETRDFVGAYRKLQDDPDGWTRSLDRLTAWLGAAMAPAIAAIAGRRTVLIPTGALTLLPLHAAWTKDSATPTGRRYVLDDCVVTYAPTAMALNAARRRPSANTESSTLLAVANPLPSNEESLAFAAVEVARAKSFVEKVTPLNGPAATVKAVSDALPLHEAIHFACHAWTSMTEPRQSGIVHAHDQMLTVDALARMDLARVKLAILSACGTGITGQEAPDELINIGTALFSAGVDGVISSLWPVLDSSTLLLMTRFYEFWHGACGDRHDAGTALVKAQRWLRDTTNRAKQLHWDDLRGRGLVPESTYATISSLLAAGQPEDLQFASPDDWAPFSYTGIG